MTWPDLMVNFVSSRALLTFLSLAREYLGKLFLTSAMVHFGKKKTSATSFRTSIVFATLATEDSPFKHVEGDKVFWLA